MVTYAVEQIDILGSTDPTKVAGMDLMSPFVWHDGNRYRSLIRAVPNPLRPQDPTGLILSASSADGLTFDVDAAPAIAPGTSPDDADAGGCEDPTVVVAPDGHYAVFYTGVDAARSQGCMIVAAGPDLQHLEKRRIVLAAPPGEGNIKEATIVQAPDGTWRLFYEYAANDASRIGIARADTLAGPWSALDDPFTVRDDSWDDWHLSTGPICAMDGGDPVMFYNGATRDARWRIGWVSFSPDYTRVTGRGLEPVILPPPPRDRAATDIAFAASTIVEGGLISLYYSIEDRTLRRARIRRYGG